MTSKEWEKQTLDADRKVQNKVKKIRNRSSRRVILGVLVAFFGFDKLNDVIKKVTAVTNEYIKTADNKLSLDVIAGGLHAAAKGIDTRLALASLVLLLLAYAVFLWAVNTRSKAEELDAAMLKWMPDADEIADIRERFDTEFVRKVLSFISAKETESVTVALDGIYINSNEDDHSFNFNREGFKRLTNYESKQLAFFIGSEAFPEGFIIHQLKKNATAYDNYYRGYTETGEIREKAPDETEEIKKNLRWLLKEIATLTDNKKLMPKAEPVKSVTVEGGHIVLNKGYSENSEKYKAL